LVTEKYANLIFIAGNETGDDSIFKPRGEGNPAASKPSKQIATAV